MLELAKLTRRPSKKIHWALFVLAQRQHQLGNLVRNGAQELFEIDGHAISVQEVYRLVSKYPEWNDRLGIGTARLPQAAGKSKGWGYRLKADNPCSIQTPRRLPRKKSRKSGP
jgi:hypothetical protein